MTFETEQMPCLVCKKSPLTVEVDKAGNLYIACGKCSLRMTVTDAQKQRAEQAVKTEGLVGIVDEFAPALRGVEGR